MGDGGIHKGHRQRLRQKYKNSGLDSMPEHEILELLLFYAIPQSNTNNTAHRLLARFGTLANVFEASIESLMQVEGVGEVAACLISMQSDLCRQYFKSKQNIVNETLSAENMGKIVCAMFYGVTVEQFHIICLGSGNRILAAEMLSQGSKSSAPVYTREIISRALNLGASRVLLAHNHPNGVLTPSQEDRDVTAMICRALAYIDVELYDHIIVAHNQYCSMRHDFHVDFKKLKNKDY
jgi:DNA repair protein RadC